MAERITLLGKGEMAAMGMRHTASICAPALCAVRCSSMALLGH